MLSVLLACIDSISHSQNLLRYMVGPQDVCLMAQSSLPSTVLTLPRSSGEALEVPQLVESRSHHSSGDHYFPMALCTCDIKNLCNPSIILNHARY